MAIPSVGDAVRDAIVINTRADICFAGKRSESDPRDRRSIHKVHIDRRTFWLLGGFHTFRKKHILFETVKTILASKK